jgi:hypothetical protein
MHSLLFLRLDWNRQFANAKYILALYLHATISITAQ